MPTRIAAILLAAGLATPGPGFAQGFAQGFAEDTASSRAQSAASSLQGQKPWRFLEPSARARSADAMTTSSVVPRTRRARAVR